jgi:6-phosphogluconolactonase
MGPEIVVAPDLGALARAAALRLAEGLERAIAAREWGFVALGGGSLVKSVYEELILLQVHWERVEFYFTDERCVPVRHPASNFGIAQDILLKNQRIGGHQIHRIEADLPATADVAERYAEELPEEFDALLVELGLDGHLAGLYPDSPAFDETERRVVALETPHKPKRRITLVPREIERAHNKVVIAAGRERAEAVERALCAPANARAIPGQLARDGLWVLDRAAAAGLGASC